MLLPQICPLIMQYLSSQTLKTIKRKKKKKKVDTNLLCLLLLSAATSPMTHGTQKCVEQHGNLSQAGDAACAAHRTMP